MGKAQSKRSVDITTETKEGVAPAEGESGKVGKIEDVDQVKPQSNGDTNKDADSGDKQEEKKDDAENEKDVASEKKESEPAAEATPVVEVTSSEPATEAAETEKPAENGDGSEAAETTLNESKDAAEAGDEATANSDSAKKPKKEKSKKRFLSFRSFSFSKKDKSKPKKEENAANTTNGDIEKVPEEATEEAAAAVTNGEAAEAEPTTNGTSEEAKVNGAPVATPEESVTPPATDVNIKPIAEIKQVAEETVKEAIVAASKSVDEKINAIVAKPEVNEQDSQNQNTSTTHVDTSVELIQDPSENANANANDSNSEQKPNNIEINNETQTKTNEIIVPETTTTTTTTTTNSLGSVDCTKIDPINNLPCSEPPALPDCPPPSQITVFAETAMSVVVDATQVEPKSIPIIETQTNLQSDESALVCDQKIEINIIESEPIVTVVDADIEQLVANIDNVKLSNESEPTEIANESESKEDAVTAAIFVDATANDESIANVIADAIASETANETDDSKQNANIDNANDGIQLNGDEPSKDDVESIEISSPLPQSLESLPSPQSSNATPPNGIANDDIATNEQNDISLPPPPADLIDTETTESELPPPMECVDDSFNESNDAKNDESATTNGGAEISNGSHTNGATDAATDHSDKENGVANDHSVSAKMNGGSDHKTIEDIATSPEKLEKLAAANPPPSTEIVAAE